MKQRLTSLDAFRGLTMLLMTIVNNPGDWGNVYPPLLHAEWHGCTPTDLVFPFFLFIVGVTTVLSNPSKNFDFEHILIRTLRIFLLGLFLNYFSKIHIGSLEGIPLLLIRLCITAIVTVLLLGEYEKRKQLYYASAMLVLMLVLAFGGFEDYKTVRIPGVLQRIALVYFCISVIYAKTSTQTQIGIFVFCLLSYWALMALVPVPNVGDANLEKGTNLAAWLDNLLLPNHLWSVSKTWDPEGILSTLPAIGTGLAGVFTGKWLSSTHFTSKQKALYMLGASLAAIVVGLIWHTIFPINKALWTSSYVVYVAGWALLVLAVLYYVTDVLTSKTWTKPLVIFGVNPMVVFFFSGIIPRALDMIKIPIENNPETTEMGLIGWLYTYGIEPHFTNPQNASLAGALTFVLIWFVLLYFFDKKKWIFKV